MKITVLIVALLAFSATLFAKKSGEKNSNKKVVSQKIIFAKADYKKFATSKNTDSIDPKIAYPKVTEYGVQHLEIIKKNDGYATVSANLLATKINIPFGWESRGGFDQFDKIFFSPKSSFPADGGLPFPYIAVKILDSKQLGSSDFTTVMKKVIAMMQGAADRDPAYNNLISDVASDKKTFFIEAHSFQHFSGKKASSLDIYIQDPTPNSSLWVDLQLSAPADQFQKYKALAGLMYQDLKIDWKSLKK